MPRHAQPRIFDDHRTPEPLTVLSYGAGQDSTAILLRLLHDPEYRRRLAPGRLLILCADTGDEHRETLYHIARTRRLCRQHEVEFFFITKRLGFHTRAWPSLVEFYENGNRIGSVSYPKSCTSSLKLQPLYKFLCAYLSKHYGVSGYQKRALYEYATLTGQKIPVLIGIAADEAGKRLKKDADTPAWMAANIDRLYPLIDLGWNRADCVSYIESLGYKAPRPSICRRCPYTTPEQVLLMSMDDPVGYKKWVELEANKLAAHAERFPDLPESKNHGVFGPASTLPDVVKRTREKLAHLSDEDLTHLLRENSMTHGHSVASRY